MVRFSPIRSDLVRCVGGLDGREGILGIRTPITITFTITITMGGLVYPPSWGKTSVQV